MDYAGDRSTECTVIITVCNHVSCPRACTLQGFATALPEVPCLVVFSLSRGMGRLNPALMVSFQVRGGVAASRPSRRNFDPDPAV